MQFPFFKKLYKKNRFRLGSSYFKFHDKFTFHDLFLALYCEVKAIYYLRPSGRRILEEEHQEQQKEKRENEISRRKSLFDNAYQREMS